MRERYKYARHIDVVAVFWFKISHSKVASSVRHERERRQRIDKFSAVFENDTSDKLLSVSLRKHGVNIQKIALRLKAIYRGKRGVEATEFGDLIFSSIRIRAEEGASERLSQVRLMRKRWKSSYNNWNSQIVAREISKQLFITNQLFNAR